MKSTIFRAIFLTSFALACSQGANAMLLVGFYQFDGASSSDETADFNATGFSGMVMKDGIQSLNQSSVDGFYGNSNIASSAGSDGAAAKRFDSNLSFSLTNSTSQSIGLADLYFDLKRGNSGVGTVSVTYVKGTSGVTPLDTQPHSAGWASLGMSLLGINLAANETINFYFAVSAAASLVTIDNVGITAIPEPASLLALGCFLGSGLLIRRNRRTLA